CFNSVAKVKTNLTYNTTVNKCTANFPAPLDIYNSTIVIGNGPSYNFFAMSQTINAAQSNAIWTYQGASGGSMNAYMNSTNIATGVVSNFGDFGTPLVIGSRADLLTGLNGWISEVVTFPTVPSNTDRAFLEWTQGQYYSISGAPALGTLPAGAQSGYIATWYDQSGSGLNAAQATTANQPRIVNAGVIEINGTKSAIKFGGTFQNLTATLPVSTYPVSISTFANTSGASTNGAFVKLGGIVTGSAGIGIGVGAAGTNFDNSGTSLIGLKEWQVWCPSSPSVNYPATPFSVTTTQQNVAGGSSLNAYLNGTNVPLNLATNITDGTTITGSLYIGGYTNVTNRFPVVKESEVSIFGSALSTTRRTLIETNQAAYYGNTISNNKYTPPTATTYKLFVNGIGRESATDTVAFTPSTVGMGFLSGLTAASFLRDNGDYITAGIDCPVASVSALNLPATVVQRWTNDWYVNKTDVGSNNGMLSIFFDFSDYGMTGILPGVAANYVLLARNSPVATFSIVTVTSTTVSGDRVVFTTDASNISTNFYYTIGTKNIPLSPLPIELLSFDAKACNKQVCLDWKTASESNNDYFTVEKTKDGSAFEYVSTVNGAGNSTSEHSYSSEDNAPYEGVSYYRLKQTDFNGAYTYSGLKMVDFISTPDFSFEIYPNPSDGTVLNVALTADKGEEVLVVVRDVTGREAYSKVIVSGDTGDNVYALDPSGKLAPGIYMITATSQQNIDNKKLIVK
ncbi:MAG: T9SS type A sorting domain-containing protein, partial [Bacteroidia bacterium]